MSLRTTIAPGTRFTRLLVLGTAPHHPKTNRSMTLCRCDCGNEAVFDTGSLKHRPRKSCGCQAREVISNGAHTTHGLSHTRTYTSWHSMKKRCTNPDSHCYHRYGGRGITFCNHWSIFENFLKDMGIRPIGRTLDRIDPNGNYEPSNCRWSTQSEQCRNRCNNRRLTLHSQTKSVKDWCKIYATSVTTFYRRTNAGMNEIDALTKPSRSRNLQRLRKSSVGVV